MNELVIDRKNFKQNRVAYGISQEEIANRCGLVSTTVSNYERFEGKYSQIRARDDNEKLMIRALYDIIQERINESFTNAINKKEDKVVGENRRKQFDITYDRKAIGEKIYKYCLYSGINITDFCKMCGISCNTFVASMITDVPQIKLQTINKILAATGWTLEQLTGPNDIPVQPIHRKDSIDPNALQKPVTNDLEPLRPNPIAAEQHDGNVKITDERYTFQDGEYFYEYTIVRKVKRKISKEQFLNDISKKEEK